MEKTWIDEHGFTRGRCACGGEPSTNPDCNWGGLSYCGDCGANTCAACRDGSKAERCTGCCAKELAAPAAEQLTGEAFAEKVGRNSMVVDWQGPVSFRFWNVLRWGVVRFYGDRNNYAVAELADGRVVRVIRTQLSAAAAQRVNAAIRGLRLRGIPGGSAAYSTRWAELPCRSCGKPSGYSRPAVDHDELCKRCWDAAR